MLVVLRYESRICHVDGVLAIGKPIEHGLRADDEEAPEFVIDANLPATQKRGGRCGPKRAAERVCCAVTITKTSAEVAADIEAGPVIGIRRSDRDVSSRRDGRRKVSANTAVQPATLSATTHANRFMRIFLSCRIPGVARHIVAAIR